MRKLGELVAALSVVEPMDDYQVVAVEQPNHPLISEIDRVEFRGHMVYIHLHDPQDYYDDGEIAPDHVGRS